MLLVGVIAKEVAVAAVTVNDAFAEIDPEVAVMVVLPAATPWARPFVGLVSLIVAAAVFEELQSTVEVMFCLLLSVKVPVAINCWLVCLAIVGFAGVTAIETNAGAIVRLKVPLTEFIVAVMVTVPLDFALSIPPGATVARLMSEDAQVTEPVKSLLE